MIRTVAAVVALGTLVAGCEPVGGMGCAAPAADPAVPPGVAAPGGVSFGGSAEFGVVR